MNPKIKKLTDEINKTTDRIINLEAKLDNLKKQKDELERIEIVEMVRSVTASPEELAEFIKAFREKGGAPDYLKKQEETHNEEI